MRTLKPAPEAEFKAVCGELAQNRHPHSKRVGLVVSLSAPQRCTEDFLMRWRGFADAHGLPFVMHVQETRMQVVTGGLFYGQPMVEYLQRTGFLKPNTSLIHAAWLNPREIEALARAGTTAQHNPWSNLMLGSGILSEAAGGQQDGAGVWYRRRACACTSCGEVNVANETVSLVARIRAIRRIDSFKRRAADLAQFVKTQKWGVHNIHVNRSDQNRPHVVGG